MISWETTEKSVWSLSANETLHELETTEQGLTEAEARHRYERFGPNTIETHRRLHRLMIFGRQFLSPLILILLIAGVITLALRDYQDAGFILAAALVNVLLGFYQENKAESALSHLKTYLVKRVRVFRDGQETEIDSEDLVPGDVMQLTQGDRVAADARLLYANDFFVDQAILTGESLPTEKTIKAAPKTAPLTDRTSMIYAGTTVAEGVAKAVVTATDKSTELGKIAELVARPEHEKTPLQKATASFAFTIGILVLFLSAGVFALAQATGIPALQAFLIAVAILVAAVPEGLPIVMTVILAIGVQRLAKNNGIVRRLSAAETLGSTTVILTDKTGTLTQAKMSLARITAFAPPEYTSMVTEEMMLRLALLNVDTIIENPKDDPGIWQIIGKPLEAAITRAAASRGILLPELKEEKKVVHFLPFNSKDKFSAAICEVGARNFGLATDNRRVHLLTMLGAPEVLLKSSTHTPEEQERILARVAEMAHQGDRVVGVAVKEVTAVGEVSLRTRQHFTKMIFAGVFSMRDPLRPGVKDALHEVAAAGIRTVIATGDHAGTAIAVARELGLMVRAEEVLDGATVEAFTLEELQQVLPSIKIIARVSPEGKLKIIQAFSRLGEVVAMTGDGVNDAPSLREADIGIAMGSGSDVAKDVADLILLDDNYETIVEAVKEGRRILDNIRKAIVYLSSTILNEIFLIGGSLVAAVALPLSPLQILWVNFFTDSFPGVALAFEDKLDGFGSRPHRVSKGIFTGEMKFLVFVNGAISSVLLFLMYIGLLDRGVDPVTVRTFIFGAFGTYSLFLVFSVRSLRRSIFRYNPFSNVPLVMSVLLGMVLMLAAIYMPFLQKLFGTVALSGGWLFAIFIFGVVNVLLIEISKLLFRGGIER